MVSSQALCIRDASWYTSPYGRKHFRCKPLRFTRKRKKASLQYVNVLLQTTAVVLQCKVTTILIVCQGVFTKSLKILAEVAGGEGDGRRKFFGVYKAYGFYNLYRSDKSNWTDWSDGGNLLVCR